MTAEFRKYFDRIPPIELHEPLAGKLSAFKSDTDKVKYTFCDTVKMAGHACPTVAGAYTICREALEVLYPDETPVRGDIEITVFGEPDETVYGVCAQVLTNITGAAPETGFKGITAEFRRKDLLTFSNQKPDSDALSFNFRRKDTKGSVTVHYFPDKIPFEKEKGERIGELIKKVIWDAASEQESKEFKDLWSKKVKSVVLEKEPRKTFLTIDKEENYERN